MDEIILPQSLTVLYHDITVGRLSMIPDNRKWLADGFSISPLELPLTPGLLLPKTDAFYGDFGIFEDSMPTDTETICSTKSFSNTVCASKKYTTSSRHRVHHNNPTVPIALSEKLSSPARSEKHSAGAKSAEDFIAVGQIPNVLNTGTSGRKECF